MAGGGVVNDQTDQTDQFKSEEWTYVHAPSWLRREVAEQVAIGGIFHVAVAAGLACSDRPNGRSSELRRTTPRGSKRSPKC